MEKKRTITLYTDMSEPDRELIRENGLKTPEELWTVYVGLRGLYSRLMGNTPQPARTISISRPSWM